MHQDLKPPNVLFSADRTQVKLCDFGVSNKVEQTRVTCAARAGSIRFMPPEQLDEQLNTKIDVWALGCILLQMITGKLPFSGLVNDFKIMTEACTRGPLEYAMKNYMKDFESNEAYAKSESIRDFLACCLKLDYNQRPSSQELLEHRFLL